MSNPFSGIITADLKLLHKQMIEALLEDTALTVPCTLTYAAKYTECPNCIINNLTGKSSGKYKNGGPIVFVSGRVCPYCNGDGRLLQSVTDTLYLVAIWDSRRWVLSNPNLKTANISVQTMSNISTIVKLKQATKISMDNKIKGYGVRDFVRIGEPEPLGLGDDNFIICSWGVDG